VDVDVTVPMNTCPANGPMVPFVATKAVPSNAQVTLLLVTDVGVAAPVPISAASSRMKSPMVFGVSENVVVLEPAVKLGTIVEPTAEKVTLTRLLPGKRYPDFPLFRETLLLRKGTDNDSLRSRVHIGT
jgi:hypothetical protein